MKKTYTFTVGTNYVGCDYSEEMEFEFEDDVTQEAIDEFLQEELEMWMWNHIELYFEEKTDSDDSEA